MGRQWKVETIFAQLPDLPALTAALTYVFKETTTGDHPITVVNRQANGYASYYPSEIVTCSLQHGAILSVLVKYGSIPNPQADTPLSGTAYEAAVYRQVLQPEVASTPIYCGAYVDPATGATWLLLRYLEEGVRASVGYVQGVAMGLAAEWIGRFHAAGELRLTQMALPFLTVYAADYYVQWAARALRFEKPHARHYGWLAELCRRFAAVSVYLQEQPATIIHGDYYADNVLFQQGAVYPIDWEQAAVAVGAIDLASLTNGWPDAVSMECEQRYQQSRWPAGAPSDFPQTLDAARLFVLFRLLGEAPNWPDAAARRWRLTLLQRAGERMGLL
jgi:hypothetical protein